MHPGAKAGLLEQHGRDQAHDGAHDADDHQRDGVGDELGPVGGPHKAEGQPGGQLLDHKELQDKGSRHHDGHFMQRHGKGSVGHAAHVQRHIVNDHAIDHDGGHDNGEDDLFKQSFRHCYKLLFIGCGKRSPHQNKKRSRTREPSSDFFARLPFIACYDSTHFRCT